MLPLILTLEVPTMREMNRLLNRLNWLFLLFAGLASPGLTSAADPDPLGRDLAGEWIVTVNSTRSLSPLKVMFQGLLSSGNPKKRFVCPALCSADDSKQPVTQSLVRFIADYAGVV